MKNGEIIQIEYEGRIERTGILFDTTNEQSAKKEGVYDEKKEFKPKNIIIGAGYLLKGIDNELEKHEVGDEFEITLPPEKAFGQRNPELIRIMPIKEFHKNKLIPIPGLIINMDGFLGKVLSNNGGRVRVDFNHALAGKELHYKIKIIKKITKKEEQIQTVLKNRLGREQEIEKQEKNYLIKTEKELPQIITKHVAEEIKKYCDTEVEFKKK